MMTATTIRPPYILLIALLIGTETDYCLALASNNKKRSRKKAVGPSRGFGGIVLPPIEQSYTVDDSPSTKGLLEFLEDEEVEGLDTLEIGHSRNGLRGVFAKESIEEGEYICAIPFVSTILVDETFVDSSEVDSDLRSANKIENAVKFHKMMETEAEKWSKYFDCLPTQEDDNFDATPDFWSDEDIKTLEVPVLVENMLHRKQEIEKASKETGIELQELQLAAWLVQSRAFTTLKKVAMLDPDDPDNLKKEGLLQRTILIPFIDFLNHASMSPNAEMQVIETKAYEESFYALVAKRKIAKGKEVRIQYGTGHETSFDLFSKYGFLPEDNQSNDFEYLRSSEVTLKNLQDIENVGQQQAVSLRKYLKNLLAKM
ncbi:unnamed protein product [Cylindrotheca closterium]|uniref:SET domain-containing protein n=1 Tax=Cylindrotheca closterium TaxID=2856 RepID=A0AAD2FEW4_9STRA|nr:unnamed protein product [Cylindrotheca closterium]